MRRLIIEEQILKNFPGLAIAIVRFQDIDNQGENPDVLAALRKEEMGIATRFAGITLTEHPYIVPWREAYRKFGAKPKDYPSSIENLVRRVLKGTVLRHINTLVDLYNTISLRYVLPVGGEDLEKIHGDVLLTYATANEIPVVLLGESEARSPKAGEVIYKDDQGAICRRWNWKEADRTKFTETTTNGFLVMEALPPVPRSTLQDATNELGALVLHHCGGVVATEILDADHPEIVL